MKIAQYGLLSILIYLNKPTLLALPSPLQQSLRIMQVPAASDREET